MNAPSCSWQNPRILLTLFVVFLCGVTFGMVLMATGAHSWLHRANASGPVWKDTSKEYSLDRLKRELDLTPTQTEQLETILDDFFTYYHTLQAQLDDVRASGKQKIMRVLDERQRQKFEKTVTELQEKQLH